jgi:hypothetical protein
MNQQQGAPGQSQGQGQPNVDPMRSQNPNNEQGKPGYDPSQPTLTPADQGYVQPESETEGRQRPGQ